MLKHIVIHGWKGKIFKKEFFSKRNSFNRLRRVNKWKRIVLNFDKTLLYFFHEDNYTNFPRQIVFISLFPSVIYIYFSKLGMRER